MKKTNVTQIRNKSATSMQHLCGTDAASMPQIRYLYAPLLQKFRGNLNKNVAEMPQTWLPVEVSLLLRYEFCTLSTHTRYIFVAILLYCAARGTDEIPVDTAFLANALVVDARTVQKSILELENSNLLLERKKEKREKKHTEQTDEGGENGVVVCADFNSFSEPKAEAVNQNENKAVFNKSDSAANGKPSHLSRFSMEECLKYAKQSDGVKNPNALANNLYQTGNADAFIMAMLYPADLLAAERETFGDPTNFTNEPCAVCFGAKMSDVDGKGYRKCQHCKDERGKSTGFEPKGETE